MNSTTHAISDLLDCAIAAARAAGDHALREWHRRDEVNQQLAHDVKLQLDVESQQKAEDVIRSAYAKHQVLGEEGTTEGDPDQPQWIVDPIDGTVNFSHGMPYWCSSVAVRSADTMLAGAVYVPCLRELYAATFDGPATCNDEPISVSHIDRLENAMICSGHSREKHGRTWSLNVMNQLASRAQKIRVMGAAALDICHVASGRADGYLEYTIYLWDIAAAGLIAERAGARTRVIEDLGGHQLRYICSTPELFETLSEIYAQAMADVQKHSNT